MSILNMQIAGLPMIVVILGIGAMLMVVLVGLAISSAGSRRRVGKRVDAMVQRSRPAQSDARQQPASLRQKTSESGIPTIDRLVKVVLPRPELLRQRLHQAGLDATVINYLVVCGATTLIVAAVVTLVAGLSPLLGVLIGIVVGIGVPHFVVGSMIGRRRGRFVALFPEAIDLMVRGLKSGLPITESIKTVSTEIADPVGGEFKRVVEQLALGKPLEEAMWLAAQRLDSPEFRFFVVSLSVQRETGGNLAETLENLADILRKRRQMKLKVRALSSEARASALILGAMPFIMFALIYVVNPRYMSTLFSDPRGNIMLGAGLVWLFIGFATMAKMVRFEV